MPARHAAGAPQDLPRLGRRFSLVQSRSHRRSCTAASVRVSTARWQCGPEGRRSRTARPRAAGRSRNRQSRERHQSEPGGTPEFGAFGPAGAVAPSCAAVPTLPLPRASQGPLQRCGALRGNLARPAPALRVRGRLRAVQGPKRYPQRHPRQIARHRTAGNRRFQPCECLMPCQFSWKHRSRSSAAPIGDAGARPGRGPSRSVGAARPAGKVRISAGVSAVMGAAPSGLKGAPTPAGSGWGFSDKSAYARA